MSTIHASLTPEQLTVGRWVKFYPERSSDVRCFLVITQKFTPSVHDLPSTNCVCDLIGTDKEVYFFSDIPESPSSIFKKHTIKVIPENTPSDSASSVENYTVEVIPKNNVSREIDISTIRSVEGIAKMCLRIAQPLNINLISLLTAFQKPNCDDALALIRNSCKDKDIDEKSLHWAILDLAIQHGQLDIVQKMVSTSTVNIQGTFKQTPLILACRYNQKKIAKWLLKIGADPSMVDHRKDNALHWAAWLGFSDIVKMLLESSIDPNAPGCAGKTALQQAQTKKHQDVVRILGGYYDAVKILERLRANL